MNICDASVLVALANDKDSQHEKATALLANLEGPTFVPNGVLVETVGVLWRLSHDSQFIASWCAALAKKMDILPESETLIRQSIERYQHDFDRFSLVDCQLIEWAKTEGATVLTFDEEINRELNRAEFSEHNPQKARRPSWLDSPPCPKPHPSARPSSRP